MIRRIAMLLLVMGMAASVASAIKPRMFDVGPKPPNPRVIAEKCNGEKGKPAPYTQAVYAAALEQLAISLQKDTPGSVEFQLNQNAAKSIEKCRDKQRDQSEAERAEKDCAAFLQNFRTAQDKFSTGKAAGKDRRSYKDVLSEFRDPLLACMEKKPCSLSDSASMEQGLDLFKIAATMIKEGVLDAKALTSKSVTTKDPENPKKERTFKIGRKFCGVTLKRLYDRCSEAETCTDRQSLANAIREFSSAPWTASGGSFPPGPSTSGSFGGGR